MHGAVGTEERPDSEEAIIANIDDEEESEQSVAQSRPRRLNAGAGVERIQMEFTGKGYGARRELNFVTNRKINKISQEVSQHTCMKITTDNIFTQMSARKGFKKHGKAAVAAIIKEYAQLNEGAVPGKPVVRPIDVSSLTPME